MSARIDAIGIVVADMARALAFYRLLGLDVPEGSDDAPHVEVPLAGGVRLMFDTEDTIRSFDPGWTPPGGGGHRVALAFACGSPADVDDVAAQLEGAGASVHLAPFDAPWGQRYASLTDPDGTALDLFAPS